MVWLNRRAVLLPRASVVRLFPIFFYICFFSCSIDVWRGYDIGHAVYSQMLRCTNFRERDGNSDRSWLMFLSGWYLTAFTLPKDMFSDLALQLFENTESKEIMPDFNHSKWWIYALGFPQCVQRGRCRWHQSGLYQPISDRSFPLLIVLWVAHHLLLCIIWFPLCVIFIIKSPMSLFLMKSTPFIEDRNIISLFFHFLFPFFIF